jgi:hypothetical protein
MYAYSCACYQLVHSVIKCLPPAESKISLLVNVSTIRQQFTECRVYMQQAGSEDKASGWKGAAPAAGFVKADETVCHARPGRGTEQLQ